MWLFPVIFTVVLILLLSVIDNTNVVFSLATGSTSHDRNILFEVVENTLKSVTTFGLPVRIIYLK